MGNSISNPRWDKYMSGTATSYDIEQLIDDTELHKQWDENLRKKLLAQMKSDREKKIQEENAYVADQNYSMTSESVGALRMRKKSKSKSKSKASRKKPETKSKKKKQKKKRTKRRRR